MKKLILLISLFSLSRSITFAQGIDPVLQGMLSTKLDSMLKAMKIKSLSAAIQFNDAKIWADAKGISAIDPIVAPTTNDAYLMGSIVKTITSAYILKLHEKNLLNIDDPISKYLDTIEFINPNATIRQLLQHTSGFYDVLSNPECSQAMLSNQSFIWDYYDLVSTFIKAPLFQPGARWSYSNTNYFLLGLIIKKVTRNDYFIEFRNNIFTPLVLKSIAIPAHETMNNPVAHAWMDITGDMVTEDAHDFYFNYLSLNSVAGSAGGYYSTPSDISKWMRAYLRGDFVSKTLVEEAKKTIPASGSQGGAYGLGLMKNTFSGQQAFGHGGDLVYSASSWYFPALDISITVCGNDQKFNSWTLLPVVNELLKTYNLWKVIAASENVLKENIELIINSNCITDKLTFNLTGYQISNDLKIDIQSIQGNKVYSEKINSSNQSKSIDISNLASGLYILSVKNSNTILQSKKIVKN